MRCYHLILFLLIILTFTVFRDARHFDFVYWDDDTNVYKNPYLNPVTSSKILRLWKQPYEKSYIPLTYTIWGAAAKVSFFLSEKKNTNLTLNPHIFHSLNIILHIFNVLIVFSILKLTLNNSYTAANGNLRDWVSGAGALFFAVHSVQVEPVVWISGMKDLLYALFSLLAIWRYLVYAIAAKAVNKQHTIKNSNYIAATISFILALLCKPAAVVVPFVIFILDYIVIKRPVKKTALPVIGWILITIPYRMGIALYIQGKIQEAIVHFKNAILINPQNADFYYELLKKLIHQKEDFTE